MHNARPVTNAHQLSLSFSLTHSTLLFRTQFLLIESSENQIVQSELRTSKRCYYRMLYERKFIKLNKRYVVYIKFFGKIELGELRNYYQVNFIECFRRFSLANCTMTISSLCKCECISLRQCGSFSYRNQWSFVVHHHTPPLWRPLRGDPHINMNHEFWVAGTPWSKNPLLAETPIGAVAGALVVFVISMRDVESANSAVVTWKKISPLNHRTRGNRVM